MTSGSGSAHGTGTPLIFRSWRARLLERGFSPASGGRRGIYLTREQDGITSALGAMLHRRQEGVFCVVLHVSHVFPFADPPHQVILVSGDLAGEGVRIDDPDPPEPGSTTWWPVGEVDRAWEMVESHGLPWLDRFSRLGALIAYLEREIEPNGLLESFGRFLRPEEDVRPPRREFLLWLALLHERRGDITQARDFLTRYVMASSGGGRRSEERKRLEDHLAELSGTGTVARGLACDDFLERFGQIWSGVFTGRPIRAGAFTDEAWEELLVPDPRSGPQPELDAWVEAVRSVGDDTCVLTEVESDERHALSSIVPATGEGMMDALARTGLGDVYAFFAVFGPSGRWGMVFEENFACLAGDRDFMDRYVRAAGGREQLRARFVGWAETAWELSDWHLRTMLTRVGWD